MELTSRKGADAFVPAGAYRRLESRLRERAADLAEIPAVVFGAFDRTTRMLPFILYDHNIFPRRPAHCCWRFASSWLRPHTGRVPTLESEHPPESGAD